MVVTSGSMRPFGWGRVLSRASIGVVAVLVLAAGVAGGTASAAATGVSTAEGVSAASVADSSVRKLADLSQFRPGNIVSDAVFFDAASMSEAEIQSFLESKVPSCRSGYTCLKDYYVQTRAISADAMCGAYSGGGVERASRVIYKVAQACGINPQVILVMLQKEQGLITSTAPSAWAYQAAMGQGCPDTAACDARYYGLFNQVYGGAWQMKRYANPPGTSNYFTWYAPGKTWNVRYHPNSACGSGQVFIENQATANLYYYTPYQPNAAALSAGYGLGDSCSSYGNRNFFNYFTDWFGPTDGSSLAGAPVGFVDSVDSSPGTLRVRGWALDPNSADSIDIHIYVNGVGKQAVADLPRPDLAPHYPNLGTAHGFDVTLSAPIWGQVDVCIYGINVGDGANRLLGCRTVASYGGSPIGYVDSVASGAGSVSVRGWTLDPDTVEPIDVHVYVGGKGFVTRADTSRRDVADSFPLYGDSHGFSTTVPAPSGYQSVCVYGINVRTGGNVLLGPCRNLFVEAATDPGTPPLGAVDSFEVRGDSVVARGWALDPDTPNPVAVHMYVGSSGAAYQADALRADVGRAYPGYGDRHGFDLQGTLPAGGAQVCIYAINDGQGANTLLGCRFLSPQGSTPPIGNIDSLDLQGNVVTVRGWAIDPDTEVPIRVHAYVAGSGSAHVADFPRRDLAAVFPAYGDAHGFVIQRTVPNAGAQVCLYAINDAPGDNSLLGCRFVVPASSSRAPIGSLDGITVSNGSVTVSGWAADPDTLDPIAVHVYVGSSGHVLEADLERPDVASAYPALGALHGFSGSVPVPAGARSVCAYAIDDTGNSNALLGCRPL